MKRLIDPIILLAALGLMTCKLGYVSDVTVSVCI